MVRVPLPQEPVRPGGSLNGFVAPRVVPAQDARAGQLQQLGQTFQQVGRGVKEAANDLEERLHIAAVQRAQALAEEKIVTADLDYMSRVGIDATGKHRKTAWENLGKELDGIANGLEEGTQRNLFRQLRDKRLTQVQARWGGHENQQAYVAEVGSGSAVVEATKRAARSLGDSPEQTETLKSLEANVRNLARLQGYTAPQTDLAVQEAMSEVHMGVVEDLADSGRATRAREYLERVGDKVDPQTRNRMANIVRTASVGEEGVQLAIQLRNDIESKFRPVDDEGVVIGDDTGPVRLAAADLEELLTAEVRERYESGGITLEVRDRAFREVERMVSERSAEQARILTETAQEAEQWLIDNPLESAAALPPSLLVRARNLGLLPQLNRFSGSAERYSSDQSLMTVLATTPDGGGLFRLRQPEFVALVRTRLDPQDFQAAMRFYAKANELPEESYGLKAEDVIKEAARSETILSRGGSGSESLLQSNAFYNFRREALRRMEEFKRTDLENKRDLKGEEMEKVVANLLQDKVFVDVANAVDPLVTIGQLTNEEIEGTITGGDVRGGSYVDSALIANAWKDLSGNQPVPRAFEDTDIVYTREIDDGVRAEIVRTIRKAGRMPTEAEIVTRWLMGGRPRNLQEAKSADFRGNRYRLDNDQ